ncbi:MAG: TlpA family protein disulfide reductase [Solirubrobacteraceae bacterium]
MRLSSSRRQVRVVRGQRPRVLLGALLVLAGAVLLAGCGSSSSSSSSTSSSGPPAATSSAATSSAQSSSAEPAPAVAELGPAQHPRTAQFPSAQGKTLKDLGTLARSSVNLGAATGTFTPGTQRFAFALTTNDGRFVYAPTAIYIATSPGAPAKGPFLAPADPMSVRPQYRSKQNSGPGGIQAIYAANVPVPKAGTYFVLALTRGPQGIIGATGELAAAPSSPIPAVGQRPPDIATDTSATVHGNEALLTTRLPPESMAAVSLDQVLGHKPVALLFSTPQLCTSRVCGPVTDIAVQLQQRFGTKVAFIHQEVYVDNQPSKGLRPQLKAFHLRTEPWLFAINRHGTIVARLEGAFGTTELNQAIQAALK